MNFLPDQDVLKKNIVMKLNNILIAGAALGMLALASCSKNDAFIGSWQAMTPADITDMLPSAANGTALTSVTFGHDADGKGGDVELTALVEASQPVVENPGLEAAYEVSVAATATVNGRWAYQPGEDDDLILTLDPASLTVNVDRDGVTFRQNRLSGVQDPVTDSLTDVTVTLWKQQITDAMRREFSRYNRLEDVKVKDKTTLKLEVQNPEQDLYFRKI